MPQFSRTASSLAVRVGVHNGLRIPCSILWSKKGLRAPWPGSANLDTKHATVRILADSGARPC
jgi:hypothetical protein